MSATWTPARIEKLLRLKRLGLSYDEIAHRLGVSKSAAVGKVHRVAHAAMRAAAPAVRRGAAHDPYDTYCAAPRPIPCWRPPRMASGFDLGRLMAGR